jgi:hypothetical protein
MDMETRPKPLTPDYVQKRIDEFDSKYSDFDEAVRGVFTQWHLNSNRSEVLRKVAVLNQIYSTNIYNISPVVEHILDLKIDDRLTAGDPALVDEIAQVKFSDKTHHLFSFATKYCAWHEPKKFQIFDSHVEQMLCAYRSYGFDKFRDEDLHNYARFAEVIENFRKYFGLEKFSRKDLDKFLYIEGPLLEQQAQA